MVRLVFVVVNVEKRWEIRLVGRKGELYGVVVISGCVVVDSVVCRLVSGLVKLGIWLGMMWCLKVV